MCNLDGLKRINDLYGHPAGAEWIKRATPRIPSTVRTVDRVARIGGDEFAIMLLECTQETLDGLLQRLINELARAGIGTGAGGANEPLTQALCEADRRMYRMQATHHQTLTCQGPALNHPTGSA